MNPNTGRLNVTDDATSARIPIKFAPGADDNLFRVGVVANDRVDIDGDLVVTGTITPDYVFSSDVLESIEEHADFMWNNQHLPALAPAQTTAEGKGLIHVGMRSQGVLEELEKAHIYIEQLHDAIGTLQNRIEKLEENVGAVLEPRGVIEPGRPIAHLGLESTVRGGQLHKAIRRLRPIQDRRE